MHIFNFTLCSPAKGEQVDGDVIETDLLEEQAPPCRAQSADAGPPTLMHSSSGLVKGKTGPVLVRGKNPERAALSQRSWHCGSGCHNGSPEDSPKVADPVDRMENLQDSDGVVNVPDEMRSPDVEKRAEPATPGSPAVPDASEAQPPSEAEPAEADQAPQGPRATPLEGQVAEELPADAAAVEAEAARDEEVEAVKTDEASNESSAVKEDDAAKMNRLLEEELKNARAKMEEAMQERMRVLEESEALRLRNQTGDERHRQLEEQLAAARRQAEAEADKRRTLEEKIEAERLRKEQAAEARELKRMQGEEEAQRVYDEAVAAAHRRLEEEKRAEEERVAAKRAAAEAARVQRARLESEALQRSSNAREEREMKEKVKQFLAENGYRHVRAKCARRTLALTYPLHCAVSRNDIQTVRLLLRIGADPAAKNFWGQTPHRYAQWLNRRGSHDEALALLDQSVAAPAPEP